MRTLITRKTPYICAVSPADLGSGDRFILEKGHKVSADNFVLVDHRKDCIFLNENLDNLAQVKDLINRIMQSKYLPEKLFDKFKSLTNNDADTVLLHIYSDWRDEIRKKALHDLAMDKLKKSKSLRIHWTVKRNKEIIRELFDIGYGLYDKDAKCDYQQGAEYAFMYGYLLGKQNS